MAYTTTGIIVALGLAAFPAWSQDLPAPPTPSIQVIGTGTVKTPPDVARLSFDLRGEGKTADEATQALVNRQKAIVDALGALAQTTSMSIHTSDMKVEAARAADCKRENRFDDSDDNPRLSTGTCAITGYVASESVNVRTSDVKDAGTAVGLAGRLGADNASVEGYDIQDSAAARRQATANALADAQSQATAIARGSDAALGALLSVRTQDAESTLDMIVTGMREPAPPMLEPAPIVVTTLPQPIETTARLVVTYAIAPRR